MNDYVHIEAADLRRPNARFTTERQGYQVLTPFGKLGYSHFFVAGVNNDDLRGLGIMVYLPDRFDHHEAPVGCRGQRLSAPLTRSSLTAGPGCHGRFLTGRGVAVRTRPARQYDRSRPMSLSAGDQLGPYTIRAELGHGGMGVVYTAHDPRLDRQVAIKVLPPDLTRDDTAKQRFLQEAKAASALDHPNICTIYEINETDDGQLYLVMAYYEGETLKERIERGPLALDEAVDIATQVGQGVEEGACGRDCSSRHQARQLEVTADGAVKILDFGLAKLAGSEGITQTGTTVGTVAYMSPEQARGQEVDHRTDIWSLGVVLYEMLTGQQPFRGENLLAISNAILGNEPVSLTRLRAGTSPALARVVTRSLANSLDGRYQSVAELLDELRNATAPTTQATRQLDVPSIAVLPFVNMSADPEQEYFCDGLAEELIDALARLDGLRVVARTSAFQFKGQSLDVAEIDQRLRVRFVLEGSVRKSGNRLRINAQLINTNDGYHVWSERYDRVLEDIFEIQDDISRAILDKLRPRLVEGGGGPVVHRYTVDVDAYTLYLKGRHHLHKRTPESFSRAANYFEQVIAKDPRLAPAYAGLADYYLIPAWYGAAPALEVIAKANSLARQALEIDPELGQAHYTLGAIGQFDWNWAEAARHFAQAVRLSPNQAVGRCWYATFCLAPTGQIEEVAVELQHATAVEPLSPLAHAFAGIGWMLRRDYAQAVKSFHVALELEPHLPLAHGYLGETYCHQQRYEEAAAELLQAQPTAPGCHFSVGLLGYCYGRWGRTDDAQGLLSKLQELSKTTYIPALSSAMTHIGMNNVDLALECLHQATEERYGALVWLPLEPIYDPLRSDPRFQALLRRMNFPDTTGSG